MMPIGSTSMINFIHWVAIHKKEISSLKHLSEEQLLSLANEFENGKLEGNETLEMKWKVGFRQLLIDKWDDFGYDNAMKTLKNAGLG